jgi:NAD(P)-dependent dehydrogenase (short-subunit alcohol dehydrogenase family)
VDLSNKAALITGGKRIGLVVARELAARGVDVAFSYARSKAEADEGANGVRAAGRRSATFAADLSKPDAAASLVQSVADTFGRLDILINMASVYVQKPFASLTAADWDASVNVDLRAAFLCAHAAAPPKVNARRVSARMFRSCFLPSL